MTDNKFKYDFFICSSANDAGFVKDVLKQLTNFSVFYPHSDMSQSSGEMYFDVLAEALENSKDFILIVTPDAAKSKWVKIEYQTFFNNFYSETNNRKIFLLHGKDFNLKDVPLFFRNFQIATGIDQIISRVSQNLTPYGLPPTEKKIEPQPQQSKLPHSKNKTIKMLAIALVIALMGFGGYVLFQHYFDQKIGVHETATRDKEYKTESETKYQPAALQPNQNNQSSVEDSHAQEASTKETAAGRLIDVDKVESENINGHEIPETNQVTDADLQNMAENTRTQRTEVQLNDYIESLTDTRIINYPNGNRYEGEIDEGVLHGRGVLYYAVRTLVSKNDPLERYAEPGNYLLGEWSNGEFYMGRLYNNKGEMIERIIIGRK